eukprot:COSAG02_NODE_60091_length_272_cov_0.647399_1_plen_71_part_10
MVADEIFDDDAALTDTGGCDAAPYASLATTLPNGSYTKSCQACVRWEQSVQCHCFSRDAVRSGVALAPGNL